MLADDDLVVVEVLVVLTVVATVDIGDVVDVLLLVVVGKDDEQAVAGASIQEHNVDIMLDADLRIRDHADTVGSIEVVLLDVAVVMEDGGLVVVVVMGMVVVVMVVVVVVAIVVVVVVGETGRGVVACRRSLLALDCVQCTGNLAEHRASAISY